MAEFRVTTLADSDDPGDGLLSLREAIDLANADADADSIGFDVAGAIHLDDALPTITDDLTLQGGGEVVLDANADGDGDAGTALGDAGPIFEPRRVLAIDADVVIDGLTLTGGFTTDGAPVPPFGRGGGIQVDAENDLRITNSIVTDNTGTAGGGIHFGFASYPAYRSTLTIENSVVSNNSATIGGGLFGYGQTLHLHASIIDGNSATGDGGSFSPIGDGGGMYWGGGLYGSDRHTITDSTISNNFSGNTGGGLTFYYGFGEIRGSTISDNSALQAGGIYSYSSIYLVNSTVSQNTADFAGGIEISGSGGRIKNTTVTENTSLSGIGGGIYVDYYSAEFASSIIAGNHGGDVDGDRATSVDSRGGNLIGVDRTGGFTEPTDQVIGPASPGLGPLADNGGPTRTHAVLPTSPAIDAGSNTADLVNDQRGDGFPRASGIAPDIGAFELEQDAPPPQLLVVDTAADEVADDGRLSLREAIALANVDGDQNTIRFADGIDVIALRSALPTITADLVIDGGAAVTLDANADGDGDAATQLGRDAPGFSARRGLEIEGDGTDVVIEGLTITGGYTDGTGGPNGGAGVRLASDTTLTLVDSEVSGNSTAGERAFGGGINAGARTTVTLEGSTVADNHTLGDEARGGGVNGSTIVLTDSVVADNRTQGSEASGGGVFANILIQGDGNRVERNATDGSSAVGGGIRSAKVTLTDSTVGDNRATLVGGGIYALDATIATSTVSGNQSGSGGGGIFSSISLDLSNSTVSGNRSDGFGAAGIYGGTVTLESSTISGNQTSGFGGGIYSRQEAINILNSLVLGNTATSGQDEIYGTAASDAVSLIGGVVDGRDVFAETIQVADGVYAGRLADNGGPTETIALLPGGLAVDAGNDAAAPATDQRGVARPQGPASDIGAFELVPGKRGTVLAAVNAGGAAVADYTRPDDAVLDAEFVDLGPIDFAADDPRSPALVAGGVRPGGSEATFVSNIPGGPEPADDPVTLSERFDAPAGADMLWEFDVGPDATVFVDLYFAEIWTGAAAQGARVFDVNLEGGPVELDDFDVYAAAGNQAERLVVETFEATVAADGILDILFTGEVQNPKVAAIVVRTPPPEEVVPAADGEAPPTLDAAADLLLA